jgi:solute:Na+ symporter, SSS family
MSSPITWGVALVLLGSCLLVLRERRAAERAERFWLADRATPSWRVALSLLATVFGASATLGTADLVAAQGLSGLWFSLIGVPGLIALGWLAPRARQGRAWSVPDLLAGYGEGSRRVAVLIVSLAWLGVLAAQVVALRRLLEVVLPGGHEVLAVAALLTLILYTAWGGQRAVLRTDALQLAMLLLGLALPAAWLYVEQGAAMRAGLAAWPGWSTFPVSAQTGVSGWLGLTLVVGLPYLCGPDLHGRLLSAATPAGARRAAWAAAAGMLPVVAVIGLLGLMAATLTASDGAQGAALTRLIPLLPPGLSWLFAVALFAAVLSSADTILLTGASTLACLRVSSKDQGGRRQRQVLVLAYGAAGASLGWLASDLLGALLAGYTLFSAAVGPPTVAALLGLRVRPRGALLAMGTGGALAVIALGLEAVGWVEEPARHLLVVTAILLNGALLVVYREPEN